jgi:hypothetical protein
MQLRSEHASDEALEQYAMHSLPEPALAGVEEHLLICSRCQEQLKEIEEYVSAMRGAAILLDREDESQKRFWTRFSGAFTFRRLAWVMGVAVLALMAIALRFATKTGQPPQPLALLLETNRGAEVPHAPAGKRIDLSLDIAGLPPFSTYAVDVVDESGRVLSRANAAGAQAKVLTVLPGSLRPGTYFVRLYSPSRELLREYGLHID